MIYELFETDRMTQLMLIKNYCSANNAHYFLRIISSMPQTE